MYRIIIIISLAFICGNTSAQYRTLNSAHGEGRQMSSVFSQNRFCGQLSAAYTGSLVNNFQNPASYADASLTSIEIGSLGVMGSYNYLDSVKSSGGVGLSHFTILMPLSAGKSGLNLGFFHNSNTNYGIRSIGYDSTFGSYVQSKTGVGNLYNFYVGTGFRIKKLKLGANIIAQFGRNDHLSDIIFPDSVTMATLRRREATTQFGFNYTLGAQYEIEASKNQQIILGGYYSSSFSKSGDLESTKQNVFNLGSGISEYIDVEDSTYSVDLPKVSKLGLGISLISKKSLLIGAELTMEDFSQFKDRFTGLNLNSAWHAHLGIEYKPALNRNNDTRKYFNRMTYRAGAIFGKSELNYEGQVNEIKLMGGLTLPVLSRSVGYITLGMEYANRGTGEVGKVSDNVFSFHLIITAADKWFMRQKFD